VIPLVFVHGLMGGSAQWQGQVGRFDGHEGIALDLPGFGANAHMEPVASIAAFADWALAELRARGVTRFDLLGHSMGGMVAQEMVLRAPARVARLVLYGTGATGILPGRFETIAASKKRARADGAAATARRISATWFLKNENSAAFEGCAAIAQLASVEAIQAGLDAMSAWNGAHQLARIEAQTLVVWGDRDRTYPWAQTHDLWQSIAGAQLAVIPGCAHALHLEKPDLFNAVLDDFLTQ
jgi:2-hydroxy-6-oxonona-2,4-dienedioate hydrolase